MGFIPLLGLEFIIIRSSMLPIRYFDLFRKKKKLNSMVQ